jgi:hypothetical protein
MTYGWALVVIVVVIAILAFLGVFNLSGAQEICTGLPSKFIYDSHFLDANGTIVLTLTNGTTDTIKFFDATGSGIAGATNADDTWFTLAPNEKGTIQYDISTATATVGTAYNLTLDLNYTQNDVNRIASGIRCTGRFE